MYAYQSSRAMGSADGKYTVAIIPVTGWTSLKIVELCFLYPGS